MSKLFKIVCKYLFGVIVLATVSTTGVKAAEAVICTSSSDGQISSLMGTDFDRTKGTNGLLYNIGGIFANTPKGIEIVPNTYTKCDLTNSLHHYDGDVNHYNYDWLKANKAQTSYKNVYAITDSLHKLYPKGRGLPFSQWKDGQNSFYTTSANPNGSLCGLFFPWKIFKGREFQLSYRFYIIEADSTKMCDYYNQPHVDVGAHNASGGYSGVTINIENDFGENYLITGGGNGTDIINPTNFPKAVNYRYDCGIPAFPLPALNTGWTVTYNMKFVNYNTNVFDCLIYYPYLNFFNADGYRVVFDYINVRLEHLCVDRDSVCPGQDFNVTAIDYNKDAKVEWQYCINYNENNESANKWITFNTTVIGEKSIVPFYVPTTVNFLDKITFRTHQIAGTYNGDKELTGGYSIPLTVTVANVAKCTPPAPELKVNNMCADGKASQTVTVSNISDIADYNWTLIDPKGNDVTSKYLSFNTSTDPNHTSAIIRPAANALDGKYTLKVFGRNGLMTEAMSNVRTFEFYIYQTPNYTLNIANANNQQVTGALCPSTLKDLKYIATLSGGNSSYTYSWTNAVPFSGEPNKATINVGDKAADYCSGSLSSVKVSVSIDNHGCKGNPSKTVAVEKPTGPFIECDELEIPTLNLSAKAVDTTYTFKLPTYSSQCGETPKLEVTITGPDGKAITPKVSDGKVTAKYPLGTSDVKIVVTDDCGNQASCEKTVTVEDVTPPNIDCNKIPNYTTYLSNYNGACTATPGKGTDPTQLPTLKAPVLEDLDHPGDMITGKFVSRSDNKTLNNAFSLGTTTITWDFIDASGNKSTCKQKVTVIDDTEPVVNCTSTGTTLEIKTDDGKCTASGSLALEQIVEQMGAEPSAKPNCSRSGLTLVTTKYIKSETDTKWSVFTNTMALEKDKVYTLRWSFKKKSSNTNIKADSSICDQAFKVTDQEAPNVDCTGSTNNVITVNYNKNGDLSQTFDYASGQPSTPTVEYTARKVIEKVPKATDNCGELELVVTVDSANAEKHPIRTIKGTEKQIVDALAQIKFMQNTSSTITYTFTDGSGNVSECIKTINVIDRTVPVAKCWTPDEITLNADDNCQGKYDGITLEKVKKEHTATMSFTRYTTKYNYQYGFFGSEGTWVIDPSSDNPSKTTITYENEVAPSSIIREHYVLNDKGVYVRDDSISAYAKPGLHADGGSYKKCAIQISQFNSNTGAWGGGMWGGGWATPTREDEITRYRMLPTIGTKADGVENHYVLVNDKKVLDTKFELGKTVLTFWYTNGDLYDENDQLVEHGDSTLCSVTIIVEDHKAPTVVCGDYAKVYNHDLKDQNCTWPFDLPEPTITKLNAKDNCTDAASLVLSAIRKFEDGSAEELKDPFKIGKTTVTWVVTDASGNNSTCENTITINDVNGPVFDCSKIVPNPVTAEADADCEVKYNELVKLGLTVPKAENDACSPVGTADSVDAVGTRSDGLDLEEPFSKHNSPITITWTVKDALGNESTCPQEIIVKDVTPPYFAKCGKLKNLKFYIKGEACTVPLSEVKKALGSNKATDNCDGEVAGVPGVGNKGSKPLPAEFGIGTTVVTWVFTDESNNSTYCTQKVIVVDEIDPDPSEICPKEPFKANAIEGTCETTVSLPELTLNDNCDGELTGVFGRADDPTLTATDPFHTGKTAVTWTFTDKSGNSSVCNGTVIVEDVTPPTLYCNYNVNDSLIFIMTGKDCGTNAAKVVEQVQIPYAYDECDGKRINDYESQLWYYGIQGNDTPTLVVDAEGNPIRWDDPDYVYPAGFTHLYFIFSDSTGNKDKCDFVVYVKDNTPPYVNCDAIENPYPVAPEKDQCEFSLAGVDLADLNHEKGYDHCGDGEYDGIAYNPHTNDPFDLSEHLTLKAGESFLIWWKYISPKGGIALCEQLIVASDTQPPVIDCSKIPNIDKVAEANKCYLSGADVYALLTPYPVATDNCGDIEGVPVRSDSLALDADYPTGKTVITWTFADSNPANTKYCYQEVFIHGSIPPEIDCDTFRTFFDTIPECETVPLDVRVPVAIDVCAPDSLKEVAGVPVRSDGKAITDAFPLGNTIIKWTFTDFTNSISSSCNDTVNVRTKKNLEFECMADTTVNVEEGQCSKTVSIKQPIAKHPCLDVTVPGIPYLGNTKLNIKGDSLIHNFRVGKNVITWVFTDTTNSLVRPVDTCYTNLQIGNVNDMPVDCKNYPAIRKVLVGNCTIDAADLGFDDPEVVDLCTNTPITPDIYRTSAPDVIKHDAKDLGTFYVGKRDTIVRVFRFQSEGQENADVIECRQPVWILDSANIKVDCLPEDSVTTLLAEAGKCEISLDALLDSLGTPAATDECIDHDIPGQPFKYDKATKEMTTIAPGEVLHVGDTIVIRWVFNDTLANVDSAFCDQKVTVNGQDKPIFTECDALNANEKVYNSKDKCEYVFDADDFEVPSAKDPCTNKVYPATGFFKSNNENIIGATLSVGRDTIVWVFASPTTTATDTCEQPIKIESELEPAFNCSSLEQIDLVAKAKCDTTLQPGDIEIPVAHDSCTKAEIVGVGVREDGGDLYSTYGLGPTVIKWTFTSEYSKTPKVCPQTIYIKTDKEIDAKCGLENYPDIKVAIDNGECLVAADSVVPKLTEHKAENPCDPSVIITAVPSRSDDQPIDAKYPIGKTTITWTFTDVTNTLVTPVSTCEQVVIVGDENKPLIDCKTVFPDTTLYLGDDDCSLAMTDVPVYLNEMPVNSCSGEVARLDTARTSGLAMTDSFAVGKDTIIWTFVFPSTNQKDFCKQAIEVKDTIAPKFDCSLLKDTIKVPITASGTSVSYDEIVAAGFEVPVVTDKCTDVFTDTTRSDGKAMKDNYELGNTTITFKFSDTRNNAKTCSQVITVLDMVPPEVYCPSADATITCLTDTPPAYKSYEEFVMAGGSLQDVAKVDVSSFRHEDVVDGDNCNATITRNYYFTTVRDVTVKCSIPQIFTLDDNVAPTYNGIPAEGLSMVTSCDAVDTIPPVVTATDNCDPNPTVTRTRVSKQGDDPSKCDYYTYDVIYTWVATDRCGNSADPVTYTVHVKDTVPPVVHAPKDWNIPTHPVLRGECIFLVPDITSLIPNDSVYQNCGSNDYLKYWQEPEAGTRVTESVVLKLHISDVCGNDTVLEKKLTVQKREDIVKVIAQDKDICADEEAILNPRGAANSLSNDDVAYSSGRIWVNDFDGSWITVRTNVLWDFFRASLSDTTVVYSNNDNTYGKRFADAVPLDSAGNAAFARYNLLLRQSQSDTYFFVATDTVSGCKDTAHAYLNVLEKPRVKIESGEWSVCDGDSIPVSGGFAAMFNPCINDMGSPILKEGWMLNGEPYVPGAEILYADGSKLIAAYYATNICGTTTTLKSLYVSCEGDPATRADSLVIAGSLANLGLMAEDKLYISDSVKVNVYTHYESDNVLLTTHPQDKARVWEGDQAELVLSTPYNESTVYRWMQVVGEYDGQQGAIYDKDGQIVKGGSLEDNDIEIENTWTADDKNNERYINKLKVVPGDSTYYYVVIGNGVCPTVSSNLVSIDVMHVLPTAITPYDRDGMNDDFMRGHTVAIFNRYGQLIFEGSNGWDGTYRGLLADPGVYYYEVVMRNGTVRKGSIEVVKITK